MPRLLGVQLPIPEGPKHANPMFCVGSLDFLYMSSNHESTKMMVVAVIYVPSVFAGGPAAKGSSTEPVP